MNIAFTSIVLFLVLAPGFVFKGVYNSTKLSVRDPNRNIINDLTWSIIPSLLFHVIAIAIVERASNYFIDFAILGNLILGVSNPEKVDANFLKIREYLYPIFFYNFSVFFSAAVLGFSIRKLIRYFKLDRRFRPLRFPNKWHYIFSGECLDFPDVPDSYEDITYQKIDVLCKVNGKSVIYIGELFNYYVDSKGDLEGIHLRYPMRRCFEKDDEKNERYYVIPSRYIVIPASEIININIKYVKVEEVDASEYSSVDQQPIAE